MRKAKFSRSLGAQFCLLNALTSYELQKLQSRRDLACTVSYHVCAGISFLEVCLVQGEFHLVDFAIRRPCVSLKFLGSPSSLNSDFRSDVNPSAGIPSAGIISERYAPSFLGLVVIPVKSPIRLLCLGLMQVNESVHRPVTILGVETVIAPGIV